MALCWWVTVRNMSSAFFPLHHFDTQEPQAQRGRQGDKHFWTLQGMAFAKRCHHRGGNVEMRCLRGSCPARLLSSYLARQSSSYLCTGGAKRVPYSQGPASAEGCWLWPSTVARHPWWANEPAMSFNYAVATTGSYSVWSRHPTDWSQTHTVQGILPSNKITGVATRRHPRGTWQSFLTLQGSPQEGVRNDLPVGRLGWGRVLAR